MHKLTLGWLAIVATGCMVGEVPAAGTAAAPAAPTALTAMHMNGGAHLTWKESTTDALHFMVMRMMHDGPTAGQMTELATVAPDATEYHDATVEAGMTYMYMVSAMNDAGEGDSNEVTFIAP